MRRHFVHQLGETGLIARFSKRLKRSSSVLVGIGDDAAVLRSPKGCLLFASDMLVEGVHFRRNDLSAFWIGWKALACNVSDIAAMGGLPQAAVVSLALPPKTPVPFVDLLYRGLESCARRFRLSIVGGDTSRAPQVVIDVAILGVVKRGNLVLRSGARPGDTIFVTGNLGGSYKSGRHARFRPRLKEAQYLVNHFRVHAMMDLSDGLSSDSWQISRASKVVLRLEEKRIPVSAAAKNRRHALVDGEDFELLFTVSAEQAKRIPRWIGSCPVTPIGTVIRRGVGVELQKKDGKTTQLLPQGFSHF